MTGSLPFSIVIPTRNCAGWCDKFLAEYRKHNVEPVYIVDPRSSDATIGKLEAAGARYERFLPKGNFIEAGTLEFAASIAEKDWILRIDDDEFPTQQLLSWANQCAGGEVGSSASIWGISRLNLFRRGDAIYYSQNYSVVGRDHRSSAINPQFRLYRKSAVKYLEKIHTPGLVLDDWAYGPPGACLLHFDALLKSAADRIAKMRGYEKSQTGFGWTYASQYLPEIFDLDELVADRFDGDVSPFLPDAPILRDTPSANEGGISLSVEEIRQLRNAGLDHSAHAIRTMFESRRDTGSRIARALPESLVRTSLGELLCTLSRFLRPFGLENSLHAVGSAIYERARIRPSVPPQRDPAPSSADRSAETKIEDLLRRRG